MVPIVANYLPKYIVVCCCWYLNDKRQRYTRLKTPEEMLTEKVVELTEQIIFLENDVIQRQDNNDEIKENFAHQFSNFRYELQLAKTALAKSVPTVEKFLRSLRLGKYVAGMRANKVTVKKLIELRGDIGSLDDPEIEMKQGHLKKMQRGLYNVKRVMDFNYKYVERRADLEMEAHLEKEREKEDEEKKMQRGMGEETSMMMMMNSHENSGTEEGEEIEWNEYAYQGEDGEEGQYVEEEQDAYVEEAQDAYVEGEQYVGAAIYVHADVTDDGQDHFPYDVEEENNDVVADMKDVQ